MVGFTASGLVHGCRIKSVVILHSAKEGIIIIVSWVMGVNDVVMGGNDHKCHHHWHHYRRKDGRHRGIYSSSWVVIPPSSTSDSSVQICNEFDILVIIVFRIVVNNAFIIVTFIFVGSSSSSPLLSCHGKMAENVWLLANVMIGFDSHTKLRTDSRRSGWLHQTNRLINQRGCWNILTVCIYCFGQVIGVSSQFVDSTSIRRGFCQCAGHKLPLQLGGGEARRESTQSVEVLFFFLAARRTRLTMTRATLARTTSSTSTTLELFVKQWCQRRHQCLHFIFDLTCIIATVDDWFTFITVTELNELESYSVTIGRLLINW